MLICQNCLIAPASFLTISVKDSEIETFLYCKECAQKKGVFRGDKYINNDFAQFIGLTSNPGVFSKDLSMNYPLINENECCYCLHGHEYDNETIDFLSLENNTCPHCGLTCRLATYRRGCRSRLRTIRRRRAVQDGCSPRTSCARAAQKETCAHAGAAFQIAEDEARMGE